MLTLLGSMLDDHCVRIKVVQGWTKLGKTGSGPIDSAAYQREPKAKELDKQKVHKMGAMNGNERAQTEWASIFLFVPKKDCTLRFYVEYKKLNAPQTWDLYLISRMEAYFPSPGDSTIL